MHHQIVFQPSYALLIVGLDAGDHVRVDAGALVSMAATIEVDPDPDAGPGATRAINDLAATAPGSEVTLAPALPGDICAIELPPGGDLLVGSGSYLASAEGIEVGAEADAGRPFFAGTGLSLLRLSGTGTAFASSYGALRQVDLGPDQAYLVDTGHVVAFDADLGYEIEPAGVRWKTAAGGDEGPVVKLTGPGRLWLQTRSPGSLAGWIDRRFPDQAPG